MHKSRLLLTLSALAVGVAVVGIGLLVNEGTGHAQTTPGPCNPTSADVDSSELELFGLVNQARAGEMGAPAMDLSGPVNRAAQWFADETAAGNTSGHLDRYGRTWLQRLIDCGYPSNYAQGSGETLGVGSSASAAFASMWTPDDQHQSGIEAPVAWACAGVGRSGSVWVVVVAQNFDTCPEPGTGSPPPPPPSVSTPPSTATPTATPTRTPTPSPTPTPTPVANYGASIQICPGWNLVTLPVTGPIDDIFDTAESNISAIYRSNGEAWQRWSPDVPAYARNLNQAFAGDVMWIYGTDAECVQLPV